jgi:hypothetical protein
MPNKKSAKNKNTQNLKNADICDLQRADSGCLSSNNMSKSFITLDYQKEEHLIDNVNKIDLKKRTSLLDNADGKRKGKKKKYHLKESLNNEGMY